MSILGKLAKLDSSLQRGLDNGFAAVFGGNVVPPEIEELLKETAADEAVRTYDDAVEAPNVFVVRVSEKDFGNLRSQAPSLPEDFADRMGRFCRNNRWQLDGPVVIVIERDASLRTGQLACDTFADSSPELVTGFSPSDSSEVSVSHSALPELLEGDMSHSDASTELFQSQPVGQSAAELVSGPTVTLLLQDGSSRTYLVHEGSNIIGRGNDVDLRLPDTGVSRRHAEVTWDGQDAVLTDLQSTNGTQVNDEPVENWLLADGDVITVGHSYIEVRFTS